MYAYKVPACTIPMYTMHWKVLYPMSSLPILYGLKLSKVRKMTTRVPNELLIFSNRIVLKLMQEVYSFSS